MRRIGLRRLVRRVEVACGGVLGVALRGVGDKMGGDLHLRDPIRQIHICKIQALY